MPVYCTTVQSCGVVYEYGITECCVVTVTVSTVLQVYRTTALVCSVVDESAPVNSTVYTGPYDCTTVTVVSMLIDEFAFSDVIGEVGKNDFTMVTGPEYRTTIGFCDVFYECGIIYITVVGTFVPVDSSTVGACNISCKVGVYECGVITVFNQIVLQVYRSTTFGCGVVYEVTFFNVT